MRTIIVWLLATLTCTSAASAAEPAATRAASEAQARTIAPFVDEGTLIVVRLDLRKMKLDAVVDQLREWYKASEPDPQLRREEPEPLRNIATMGKAFQQEILQAGGQEMYILASLADFPRGNFFTVVPLAPGANAERIQELLYNPPGGRTPSQPGTRPAGMQPAGQQKMDIHPPLTANAVAQMRGAVVASYKEVIERLKNAEPLDRPELAQAFASGGNGAFQLLVIPSPTTRLVLQSMMPELPPVLGSGPTASFTEGYHWGILSIDPPPETAVRGVIQMASPQSAQTFRTALAKALRAIGQEGIVQRVIPDYEKGVELLLPDVKGDRLTLSLNKQQVDRLVRQMAGAATLMVNRMLQRRNAGWNMVLLQRGIDEYYDKHKAWPEDLQVLAKEGFVKEALLTNPVPGKKGFVYLKPTQTRRELGENHILLHEPYTQWREGIVVVYANQSSEVIEDETVFLQRLAKTKEANAGKAATTAPVTQPAKDE